VTNDSTIPTPATPDVCAIAILVDGSQIPGEYHVLSVQVKKELNRIPSATLHLKDGEAAKATFEVSNADHFIPGKKLEIKLGYRGKSDTVFKGIVVKQSVSIRKSGSLLTVECRDEAVKMASGFKSRYFINQKDSAIMEDIIGSYQLQKDVKPTKPTLKEVTQYNSTDWDFLILRAETNGQVVIASDGKITVAEPASVGQPVVTVKYGSTLLELDVEMDARWQSKSLVARSWNPTNQEVLEVTAKEPPKAKAGNLSTDALADAVGSVAEAMRHGGNLSQPELQAWADGRLLKERLAKLRGRAKFQGFAGVLPGDVIEVAGIGDRFSGQIYVSGVRHNVEKGNWETDVQFGLSTESFAETYNLAPLPAAGLLPAVSGLQIGIVTALENDPDGEDRIRVRLPLVSKSADGVWARLATLDAGKNRGTFFRPELKDEVVVGFLNDDPCNPVVLGMCNSSAKPAPEPARDTNHRKGYVSREKIKFIFDDQMKSVQLQTPGGNQLTISDDGKGIVLQDQNSNKITMDDSGIKIESSKALTLKAATDLKIEGANVTVSAQTAFKASGNASAEISGASTSVKGSATTVIQGGIVQIN